MNRRRGGVLAVVGLMVLLVGVLIGSRIATSGGSAAPPAATVIVLSTAASTATPSPTPAVPPLPKGLGTRYYEADNAADTQITLRTVGRSVVADVQSNSTGSDVYTGTVKGVMLTAAALRNPNLDAPHSHRTLIIRATQPGEAAVTQSYPNNNSGVGAYSRHFAAICGSKTDAFRGQSCQALTKP